MSARPVLDQAAHAGVILIALIPVIIAPGVVSCGWAGFVIGMLAEVKERGSIVTSRIIKRALASRVDLAGYTIAGLVVGAIA